MPTKPYPVTRVIRSEAVHRADRATWRIEMDLADDADESRQSEHLRLMTQVSIPLPPDRPTLELTALLRVRSLLDLQIRVLQSP